MAAPEIDESKILEIISRIPHERTLKGILKEVGISATQFFNHLLKHPHLENLYAQSQSARAELLADEVIDIADTESDPQRARNRIDARKWAASKLKPNKFGDRLDLNVNHTVDISEALKEARLRTNLIPQQHPNLEIISQPIDITPDVKRGATDRESVEQPKLSECLDDIFK